MFAAATCPPLDAARMPTTCVTEETSKERRDGDCQYARAPQRAYHAGKRRRGRCSDPPNPSPRKATQRPPRGRPRPLRIRRGRRGRSSNAAVSAAAMAPAASEAPIASATPWGGAAGQVSWVTRGGWGGGAWQQPERGSHVNSPRKSGRSRMPMLRVPIRPGEPSFVRIGALGAHLGANLHDDPSVRSRATPPRSIPEFPPRRCPSRTRRGRGPNGRRPSRPFPAAGSAGGRSLCRRRDLALRRGPRCPRCPRRLRRRGAGRHRPTGGRHPPCWGGGPTAAASHGGPGAAGATRPPPPATTRSHPSPPQNIVQRPNWAELVPKPADVGHTSPHNGPSLAESGRKLAELGGVPANIGGDHKFQSSAEQRRRRTSDDEDKQKQTKSPRAYI